MLMIYNDEDQSTYHLCEAQFYNVSPINMWLITT